MKEHLVELSFRMNEAGLSKMGTDWLRQLKERLDSGEWLTHTPEGEPEGILTGVFVDQTRRIGLVYQQPGDDQYFQIFLNPDGTKADAFWSSRKTSEPEVYSEDEPSDLAEAMMEYLDCECTYFPSMTDDDPIMSAYNYAKMESVKEGFVPVLIKEMCIRDRDMMAGKAELFSDQEIREQILKCSARNRSRPWAARCGGLTRRYGTSSNTPLY